jgi:CRP-like cAMP-binding protein
LYQVRSGRVVIKSDDGGNPVVSRIVGPNGIFGESLLVGSPHPSESAVVLDQTRLMSWGRTEIEQQINREPRLGLALLGYFVERCAELNARL